MSNLKANLPHLVMAVTVITAMTILAVAHIVSGPDATVVIVAAGGFSLGAGGASASISAATHAIVVPSDSSSNVPTVTVTAGPQQTPAPTQPPAGQ